MNVEILKLAMSLNDPRQIFYGIARFDNWLSISWSVYPKLNNTGRPYLEFRLGRTTLDKDGKYHNPVHAEVVKTEYTQLKNTIINMCLNLAETKGIDLDEVIRNSIARIKERI